MTPGTPSNIPRTLSLNTELFEETADLRGWKSDVDVARALGISDSMVQRVRNHKQVPSPLFIGSFLYVVRIADFRQMFDLVPTSDKEGT